MILLTGVLRAPALLLATLVSLSRIMVGVHWPVDILWGMLGGWLGAWAGLAMHGRWGWRTAGVGGFLAGLLLAGVAAALLVSRHIRIPAVLPAQRVVGCVSLVRGAWEMAGMPPVLRWRAWWRSRWRRAWWHQQIKGRTDG